MSGVLLLQQMSDIRAEFTKYDTDEQGSISQDELSRVLQAQGVGQEEIEKLFNSMDLDHRYCL
jgi:Ca2+-binding EF-hand superfamily protein